MRSFIVLTFVVLPGMAVADIIPWAYRQVAHEYRIPANLLYAVALTESNYEGVPYPWTLNVNGTPKRYRTKQAAQTDLQRLLESGTRNIDVGLMQINFRWNPDLYRNPGVLLDPWYNLRTAARIIRQRYQTDWLQAAQHYHRPAGGPPARRYGQQVKRYLDQLP